VATNLVPSQDSSPFAKYLQLFPVLTEYEIRIAPGAQYRKLPLENLSRFAGAGINYGATFLEAQLCGVKKSLSSVVAIRPDWLRSFSRRPPGKSTCSCAPINWRIRCRAT
jgi:hypothetical protein